VFQLPNVVVLYRLVNGLETFLGEGYLGGSWTYPAGTGGILGESGGPAGTCSINLNCSPFDLRDFYLQELADPQQRQVEAHVRDCAACREELDRLRLRASLMPGGD